MAYPLARSGALAAAMLALLAGAAAADVPQRVRGTVANLTDETLTVNTREGTTVEIALTEGWKVAGVAEAALADIDKGDFVGIASLPTEDGTAGALEVLIFPEAMAGAGEGSYPWDLQPGSTMTNATVADKVEGVDGNSVSVTYGNGESKDIVIPEGTPIVTFADATKADLVQGATVFVPGHEAGGVISTDTVVVGKGGIVPPM